MNSWMHRVTPILLLFLVSAGTGCSSKSFSGIEVTFLEKGKDTFFAEIGRHMSYIELRKDGTYVDHAGTSCIDTIVMDEGRWSQDREGVVTITAKRACADVVAPPLRIWFGGHGDRERLPEAKYFIVDFLSRNAGDRFPVGEYPSSSIFDGCKVDVRYDFLETDARPTHVTREQLKALIAAIDAYLKDPALRNRRAKLLRYGNYVFLFALNYGTSWDWDLPKMKKFFDKGHHPPWCPVQITEPEFKEATAVSHRAEWLDATENSREQNSPANAGQ